MSILNDIQKLHYSLHIILVSVILMPFMYASIYFFNQPFYLQADIYILLVVTFILSLLINLSIFIFYDIENPLDTEDKDSFKKHLNELLSTSILISIFWIVLIDFVLYTALRFWNFNMIYYFHVLIYFAPAIFDLIWLFINHIRGNKSNKEESCDTGIIN